MSGTIRLSRRAADAIAAAGRWLREHVHTVAARLRQTRANTAQATVTVEEDDAAAFVARLRAERIAREEAGEEPTEREQAAEMLRSCGYEGSGFEQLARAAFREIAEQCFLAAERDCRGTLLTPAGERAGIDPRRLFVGPRAYAHKWASEELIWWWEANGRLSFEEYAADLLGHGGAAVRADHAVMSS